MKTIFCIAIYFCATSSLFADFIATGQFASDPTGSMSGWLASIDEATGRSQILAYGPGPNTSVQGLARDPMSETFYVARRSNDAGASSYIQTFTLENPTLTALPSLSQNLLIGGLAIAPQGGLLYLASSSSLFNANPTTGAVTRVADLGRIGTIAGLAIGPDGLLYGYTRINREAGTFGVGMFRYDLATGRFTVLTPPGVINQVEVNGLSFAPDGTLWGIQSNFNTTYYKFDSNSGLPIFTGFTRLGAPTGIAFLPAATPEPIPEPSYAAVASIACVALILGTRRRGKLRVVTK